MCVCVYKRRVCVSVCVYIEQEGVCVCTLYSTSMWPSLCLGLCISGRHLLLVVEATTLVGSPNFFSLLASRYLPC